MSLSPEDRLRRGDWTPGTQRDQFDPLPPRVDRPSPAPPPSKAEVPAAPRPRRAEAGENAEPLNHEQLARARALGVAREALSERTAFGRGSVGPVALITVADWVLGQEAETEPEEDRIVVRDHSGGVLYTLSDACPDCESDGLTETGKPCPPPGSFYDQVRRADGAEGNDGLTETEREADRQAEQARHTVDGQLCADPRCHWCAESWPVEHHAPSD